MKHIKGATFEHIALFSTEPGAWVGWTPRAQVRGLQGTLYEELECSWNDPETTLHLKLLGTDQSKWLPGEARFAIKFTRNSDGYVRVTDQVTIYIEEAMVF